VGDLPVEIDDVLAAAQRLAGVVRRTPVLTSRTLDEIVGATVFLKAECFQRTGSFKLRGAYNAVASLPAESRARGVVAYSSGNHAQGLARAAQLHGIPATIVMPQDAPTIKRSATEGYGADVVAYDRYMQDREAVGARVLEERGGTLIPPFDHPDVMAGQGTVALELLDEVGPLDALLVCVGGGGLISGCATAAKATGDIVVIGVEPAAGDDARRSLEEGRIVTIDTPVTIADGQQTTSVGELTFAVMQERVDEIVVATDDEIRRTMRFLFERLNIVVEPSGACALAALMAGRVDLAGGRVGVTLSGGNVSPEQFAEIVGLVAE
jgi:threo-3-hydroxy-L-aspartate ammonia-lyase